MGESPGFAAGDWRFLREAGSRDAGVCNVQFDTHVGFEAKPNLLRRILFCGSQLSLFGLDLEIAVMTRLGRPVTGCAIDLSRQPRDQFLGLGCLHTVVAGRSSK